MHRCPSNSCKRHRLHRSQVGRDVYWSCGRCHGRAVSISTIAHRNEQIAHEILETVRATVRSPKECPFCGRSMGISFTAGGLELDYCSPCQAIWFDPGETDELPASDIQEHLRTPSAKAIKIQLPDKAWQYAATFIGLPAESHARPMDGQPAITWFLVLATVCLSVMAFADPHLRAFAFIPNHPARLGGVTFISSFFLHGGWFHLLSNMYFLWVFGDDSEDYLGKLKYFLLILLATAGGNLCVLILQESPEVPHIGASGGIFGVLTFYLLNFPRSRITFFKFFLWIRVSPFLALLYMMGIQFLGMWMSSHHGMTAVSYGSHVGGGAVGLMFWLLFGEKRLKTSR